MKNACSRCISCAALVVLSASCVPDPSLRNNPRDPDGVEYCCPTADFTVNGALSASTFEDAVLDGSASIDPTDGILFYRWDFVDEDDGEFDTQYAANPTASYRYATAGTYEVTLEVLNGAQLTHSVTKSVVVASSELPVAVFSVLPESPVLGEVVTFDASESTDDDTDLEDLQFRWDFVDDGEFDTEWSMTATATHTYPDNGIVVVRLEVMDVYNLVGSTVQVLNIGGSQPPTAAFTCSQPNPLENEEVLFDAAQTTDDDTVAGDLVVRWDFDNDGVFDTEWSTTRTASHAYAERGTYTVEMEARDGDDLVSAATAVIDVEAEQKLLALDGAAGDKFGWGAGLCLSGEWAFAGSINDDYDTKTDAGSVYVFRLVEGAWTEFQKLTPIAIASGDNLFATRAWGAVLATGARSSDIAAVNAGAVFIYNYSGSTWEEGQTLTASDAASSDYLGVSLALEGDLLLAGACCADASGADSGAVYFFRKEEGTWTDRQKIVPDDGSAGDRFGAFVDISGTWAVATACMADGVVADSGAAYVFSYDGEMWNQEQKLQAPDGVHDHWFGETVGISGDWVVVGSRADGPSAGYDDTHIDAAYIYHYDGESWQLTQQLAGSDTVIGDVFGRCVAIDGDRLVISAQEDDDNGTDSGSIYVFGLQGLEWVQQKKIVPSDVQAGDSHGEGLYVLGDRFIVGGYLDDDLGTNAGAAYIYY